MAIASYFDILVFAFYSFKNILQSVFSLLEFFILIYLLIS